MVVISDMEHIPKSCYDCDFHNYHFCDMTGNCVEQNIDNGTRADDCPLKEIPSGKTKHEIRKIFIHEIAKQYKEHNKPIPPWLHIGDIDFDLEVPSGKWIPVSERLPEPYMFVNATCRSLVDDRENWVVETIYLPIPKEHNPRHYSDWGNIPMLNWGDAEVIAWMERIIPEPYKMVK